MLYVKISKDSKSCKFGIVAFVIFHKKEEGGVFFLVLVKVKLVHFCTFGYFFQEV